MQKKQKTQKKVAMPDSQPPSRVTDYFDAAQTILLRDGGDRLTIASVAKVGENQQKADSSTTSHRSRSWWKDSSRGTPGSSICFSNRPAIHPDQLSTPTSGPPADRMVRHPGGLIAMLAAVIVDSEALGLLRQKYDHWNERLHADGIPPHIVSTVRYAVDGLWLADTLQLAPPRPELSRQDNRIPPADGGALQSGTEHMNA